MYSVYQHWDPLRVCVVGRSYPPEFYSWITVPHVRDLFEKIAIETEEDFQNIIKKLQEFGVEVLRPDLLEDPWLHGRAVPPPMAPRDHTVMIGNTFYNSFASKFKTFYDSVRDPSWPDCDTVEEFYRLPEAIQDECMTQHGLSKLQILKTNYDGIFNQIKAQGNAIKNYMSDNVNGAMVYRIGRDLFFGTVSYRQDQAELQRMIDAEFVNTRNHVINTGGHSDGTFCPVCPGLIVSLQDVPTYKDTFPDWEVLYLPGANWSEVEAFMELKKKNSGKWWIPGFEKDQAVIDFIETGLNHWTGYVEETVLDVNMLIIDPKNVIVFKYNKQVFDALARYGITAHVIPFRHRYFWDGGIHCVTSDLHREGTMQDYFKERT